MSKSKSEARVLDVFGPNLVIETNGPVGLGGPIAYQLYAVNDKGAKWQQALHGSGLASMEADHTLEIQTGKKNKKQRGGGLADNVLSFIGLGRNEDKETIPASNTPIPGVQSAPEEVEDVTKERKTLEDFRNFLKQKKYLKNYFLRVLISLFQIIQKILPIHKNVRKLVVKLKQQIIEWN